MRSSTKPAKRKTVGRGASTMPGAPGQRLREGSESWPSNYSRVPDFLHQSSRRLSGPAPGCPGSSWPHVAGRSTPDGPETPVGPAGEAEDVILLERAAVRPGRHSRAI